MGNAGSNRRRLGIAAIAVGVTALLLALCVLAKGLRDNSVAGCIARLNGGDSEEQEDAERTLVGMGKAAVPALASVLIQDGAVNRNAAFVLKHLGPDATDAIPELIRSLGFSRKPYTPYWEGDEGCGALIAIGPAAIPALVECARKDLPHASGLAAKALAQIGGEALPYLFEMLRDKDPLQRANAADALSCARDHIDEVIARLLASASDPDYAVRAKSIASLGTLGPDRPSVIEAFAAALGDECPPVVAAVLGAYLTANRSNSDPPPTRLLPGLIELLATAESQMLLWVCTLIIRIGPPDACDAVPALIKALDRPGSFGEGVAATLFGLDPTAPELRPALLEALRSNGFNDWLSACSILEKIAPPMPEALPLLQEKMTFAIGPLGRGSLPLNTIARAICWNGGDIAATFAHSLRTGGVNPERLGAIRLVAEIIANSTLRNESALRDIIHELARYAPEQCLDFCGGFGPTLGETGREAIPIAVSHLNSNIHESPTRGWEVLRNIGPAAAEALPVLRKKAEQGDPGARAAIDSIQRKRAS